MNWLEWYRIVASRDTCIVLVANATDDAFWILDSGNSPIYTIHDAGHSLAEATTLFERHVADPSTLDAIGCIPVEHVQFDDTRRRELKLTSPPIT